MLQINTGKLFSRPIGRQNHLRGVLYTNLIFANTPLITNIGKLTLTSELFRHPQTIIYEFMEQFEEVSEPEVLISHGADPYLDDISVIISFALNGICTPDFELTSRLISGQRGLLTGVAPNNVIRRTFNEKIHCTMDEEQFLSKFLLQLVGLHRKTYLSVMRAIRTYITALHRVADDLELSYTLMVAAIESLAQDFDGHQADWDSYDERKRTAIDKALLGADDNIKISVRQAILDIEHTSLSKRFRNFVAEYVSPDYFEKGFNNEDSPLGRAELPEVLNAAYQIRSKYIHQLKQLPSSMSWGHGYRETILEDRTLNLTLQGLSRLVRHIITEFIWRQPVINKEEYNYSLERAGIAQIKLAPEYWVGNTGPNIENFGRVKLEGFLDIFEGVVSRKPDITLPDMREVLKDFLTIAPTIKKNQRIPYWAIYALFNKAVAKADAAPLLSEAMSSLINSDLKDPSPESLLLFSFFEKEPAWAINTHHENLRKYLQKRGANSGIRFPRVFEAIMAIGLAERYRSAGDLEQACNVIIEAADNFPENDQLRSFAQNLSLEAPFKWHKILFPEEKESENQ